MIVPHIVVKDISGAETILVYSSTTIPRVGELISYKAQQVRVHEVIYQLGTLLKLSDDSELGPYLKEVVVLAEKIVSDRREANE